MDNFTKNILTGIRQWFHKNQDDTSVVLSAHVNRLYSLCSALQKQIAENKSSADTKLSSIDDSLSTINKELSKKLITLTLTQEEYDALENKSPVTLYIISNPGVFNCYIGTEPIYSLDPSSESLKDYLCFEADGELSSVWLADGGVQSAPSCEFEYSVNGYVWKKYTLNEGIYLSPGGRVYFRGNSTPSYNSARYYTFSMKGKLKASGKVSSLYSADVVQYKYAHLFKSCSALVSAPQLPELVLTSNYYDGMFSGCTSLTSAPELPATTLAYRCYASMFENCYALTTVPTLPAITLKGSCYKSMFVNCRSITATPKILGIVCDSYCCDSSLGVHLSLPLQNSLLLLSLIVVTMACFMAVSHLQNLPPFLLPLLLHHVIIRCFANVAL